MATKTVTCDCGATFRENSDDVLIQVVQRHAKEAHDMTLSREQVLSMAEVVPERA